MDLVSQWFGGVRPPRDKAGPGDCPLGSSGKRDERQTRSLYWLQDSRCRIDSTKGDQGILAGFAEHPDLRSPNHYFCGLVLSIIRPPPTSCFRRHPSCRHSFALFSRSFRAGTHIYMPFEMTIMILFFLVRSRCNSAARSCDATP